MTSAQRPGPGRIRHGGYYDGSVQNPQPDEEFRWTAHCVDLTRGAHVWRRVLHRGVPKVDRQR